MNKTFEDWYKDLVEIAAQEGFPELIGSDAESYREYFDDGDSPKDVFEMELSYCD